jgi:hypothetical protein
VFGIGAIPRVVHRNDHARLTSTRSPNFWLKVRTIAMRNLVLASSRSTGYMSLESFLHSKNRHIRRNSWGEEAFRLYWNLGNEAKNTSMSSMMKVMLSPDST